MQKNNRKKRNNKGFSMVELIIVIAIMAALVGILAPQYIKYVERSRVSADITQLDELVKAVKIAASDTVAPLAPGDYALDVTDGSCDLTDLGATVTNALGATTMVLKSDGAVTAAGDTITISIAATTYVVTCSLTYSGTSWTNS